KSGAQINREKDLEAVRRKWLNERSQHGTRERMKKYFNDFERWLELALETHSVATLNDMYAPEMEAVDRWRQQVGLKPMVLQDKHQFIQEADDWDALAPAIDDSYENLKYITAPPVTMTPPSITKSTTNTTQPPVINIEITTTPPPGNNKKRK